MQEKVQLSIKSTSQSNTKQKEPLNPLHNQIATKQ